MTSFIRAKMQLHTFITCNQSKNLAKIASPLKQLLNKDISFHWDAAQKHNFQDLKHAPIHAPVLTIPKSSDPFYIYTDPSSLGLGALLRQNDDKGKNHVIEYVCKSNSHFSIS